MDLRPVKRSAERSITKFQDAFSDLFNRFFENWDLIPSMEGRTWWPLLDVNERENEFVIRAELPGMKSEDIQLTVQGNVLTISGEKLEKTEEEKKGKYYHVERRYGSFRRDVTLPSSVDADKIEAGMENGVLTVTLPKTEQAKPKKISVHEHALTK